MKAVAILGSPHGPKGATAALLAEVVRGVKEAGAEVTAFSLVEHRVNFCVGCDACHKTGTCPQKDGFNEIKAAMQEADAIILASPNYINSVSAQMKALFDRCCGPLHCQSMLDKYGVAIESSGGTGGQEVQQYMLRFLRTLGCWAVGSVGATAAEIADPAQRALAFAAANDLGRTLVQAVTTRQTFPKQVADRTAFFERMKALVTYRKNEWPYEYKYWQDRGWL